MFERCVAVESGANLNDFIHRFNTGTQINTGEYLKVLLERKKSDSHTNPVRRAVRFMNLALIFDL